MERKVGEVFKLRCKKYKTVENKDGFRCFNCDLYELLDCFSPGIRTSAMIFIVCALGISLYIMADSFKYMFKDVVKIEIIKKQGEK